MTGLHRSVAIGVSVMTLGLGACSDAPKFFYPSPDGIASLVVEPEHRGGPKAGVQNRVYLQDEDEASFAGVSPKKVAVGSFVGPWAPASIAWVGVTTVNVCPLGKSADVVRETPIVVTDGGAKRTYRLTTDCSRARRAPSAPQPKSDAQQRPAG